jgi:L-amino acid N-acyltransferase YncA
LKRSAGPGGVVGSRRYAASQYAAKAENSELYKLPGRPPASFARSMSVPLLIRPGTADDVGAATAIYAHHVQHGSASFETVAPDAAEMARRRDAALAAGWPWLVAERERRVVGFAYAGTFRPREAYRYCVEDSLYVADQARGQGIGRWLLAELIGRCEAAGARQMVAVIGDSANAASIGVHCALGFESAGVLRSSGWKFGRWLDVVLMQRPLGAGDRTPPEQRRDSNANGP